MATNERQAVVATSHQTSSVISGNNQWRKSAWLAYLCLYYSVPYYTCGERQQHRDKGGGKLAYHGIVV